MRYLFLTKSSEDPATRYRVQPITRALVERGDQVRILNEPGTLGQLGAVLGSTSFDAVFIQRKLLNTFVAGLLSRTAKVLVFDHDDAIFLKSSGEKSVTRGRRYRAIVEAADLVLGGNTYLCDAARNLGGVAELVPTSVETDHYHLQQKEEQMSMVWIGSRSTSRYLEHFRATLNAIGAHFPDLEFKIIGDFQMNFEHLRTRHIAWSQVTETSELAKSHIGIAPMVDDRWTRGKCALKVIQYMAAGLPVVSSDTGANHDVVRHGLTGFLANSEQDWLSAIEQLVNSRELRQRMGEAGRSVVKENYSTQAAATRVLGLLDTLTSGRNQ
ncbi:MAG: glycosyltransferase family 4 protein [Gammaproteobacteria bacterium]|jgi:glycosyltransferase involved in cell wall biosynthesis|nr:glycosyltransferase family 4 protein [Gammaproteobacteria bacterium]MBT4494038.1 glycosyltransferase family 4 protein [Gammaproteobacteria bacterium]MBT7369431.1 glycosyltransferase family 4 protein [Gammaproteobacteria bacterium]